ncbi:MAG TPA: acetylglutamate kinase [Deinococcales bacterium]|nr:acetylglutamate kinase [Deinococcales bacterium]
MVIKYGGNAMKSLDLRRTVAREIAALRHEREVVVVHGGGPVIEASLKRLAIESRFERGLRVTTPDAMDVIEQSITRLSKELAQDVGRAVGLTGRDDRLLAGEVMDPEVLGRVGRVTSVNTGLLDALLAAGLAPVIGCIAVDDAGEPLNVNADWAAGAVAGAMNWPIVFLTDVPGVLQDRDDPASLIPSLTASEARSLIGSGVIAGGMIPKVEAALEALERGASSATVASGMTAGVLAAAAAGLAGTRITAS